MEFQHLALPIRIGAAFETQSGLQANLPRVFGVLANPGGAHTAVILMHPASNLMNHYLIPPLSERGVAVMALNSRYCGGDQVLIMEQVIQDLGAGVRHLRSSGFRTVALLGNSGGAALTAFYQAQAEKLTVCDTPAGDPVDLRPEDLPPVDGIALLAGHPGRSRLMQTYIDAAVADEGDPEASNPTLDVYNAANGPPFSQEFVKQIRVAQRARVDGITVHAQARLRHLRAMPEGARDEAMIVHRTYADPRFLDLSLDSNDRKSGGNRGESPRQANCSANNLGRFTTLTSWLSQWSPLSRADGPSNLRQTSVPVLQLEYTADAGVFPSDVALWSEAGGARVETRRIVGASHYLQGQPAQLAEVVQLLVDWATSLKK